MEAVENRKYKHEVKRKHPRPGFELRSTNFIFYGDNHYSKCTSFTLQVLCVQGKNKIQKNHYLKGQKNGNLVKEIKVW